MMECWQGVRNNCVTLRNGGGGVVLVRGKKWQVRRGKGSANRGLWSDARYCVSGFTAGGHTLVWKRCDTLLDKQRPAITAVKTLSLSLSSSQTEPVVWTTVRAEMSSAKPHWKTTANQVTSHYQTKSWRTFLMTVKQAGSRQTENNTAGCLRLPIRSHRDRVKSTAEVMWKPLEHNIVGFPFSLRWHKTHHQHLRWS